MSYRDRDFNRGGEFDEHRDHREQRPDQYGQEHYGRGQFGQPQQRNWDQTQRWDQSQRGNWQSRDQRGADWRNNDWRESEHRPPSAHEPFGHQPFTHSAFGESNPPRYFGTGSQGHGGGPSFTGGTYGTADWRSDAPYFEEVGFNRGNNEDSLGRENHTRSTQRSKWAGTPVGRQQRRYPLGPKGYTRSDERLREDISERLMEAYDIDSSEVTVQVLGARVVLEGTVPTRYMKHAIEDIADAAPGVQDVDNRVRVVNTTSRGWSSSTATEAGNPSATTTGGATTTSNGRTGVRRDA
jgi:hypothetical protein